MRRFTHLGARDRAEVGAIFENHVGAVASHGRVELGTKAAGLRQTPFAATRPAAIIHHRGVNGLTHHRFRFDAGMESSEITSLTRHSDYPVETSYVSPAALFRITTFPNSISIISHYERNNEQRSLH